MISIPKFLLIDIFFHSLPKKLTNYFKEYHNYVLVCKKWRDTLNDIFFWKRTYQKYKKSLYKNGIIGRMDDCSPENTLEIKSLFYDFRISTGEFIPNDNEL